MKPRKDFAFNCSRKGISGSRPILKLINKKGQMFQKWLNQGNLNQDI